MAKTGRPRKSIDKHQFETLCALQCTEVEICDFFDVTDKTLCAWCRREYKMTFSDVFKIKRNKGKISLRRYQYKEAEKGNVSMLIWLGKQWLGQSEKPYPEDRADTDITDEVEQLLAKFDEE